MSVLNSPNSLTLCPEQQKTLYFLLRWSSQHLTTHHDFEETPHTHPHILSPAICLPTKQVYFSLIFHRNMTSFENLVHVMSLPTMTMTSHFDACNILLFRSCVSMNVISRWPYNTFANDSCQLSALLCKQHFGQIWFFLTQMVISLKHCFWQNFELWVGQHLCNKPQSNKQQEDQ